MDTVLVRLPGELVAMRRNQDAESRMHLAWRGTGQGLCGHVLHQHDGWCASPRLIDIPGLVVCEACLAAPEVPYPALLAIARGLAAVSASPQRARVAATELLPRVAC